MVFENEHLLSRDQKDFESYWLLMDCEAQIDYHVGLQELDVKNSLIIVDEADTFMLNNTESFI